jgi:hypothetical protein
MRADRGCHRLHGVVRHVKSDQRAVVAEAARIENGADLADHLLLSQATHPLQHVLLVQAEGIA